MIVHICDRCKEEIKDRSYSVIVKENPDKFGRISTEQATENLLNYFNEKDEYCRNCIIEIRNVINNKEE